MNQISDVIKRNNVAFRLHWQNGKRSRIVIEHTGHDWFIFRARPYTSDNRLTGNILATVNRKQ